MWSLSLLTPPDPALDLETEVKPHVRLDPDQSPQEVLLQGAIEAATVDCEAFTNRQMVKAQYRLTMDRWFERQLFWGYDNAGADPWLLGAVRLPRAPLITVDEVKYTDLGGNEQVWDPLLYIVEAPAGPRCQQGRFWPVYGQIWPITRPTPSAIKIKFTCGYATPAVVPYGLKAGMLLEVAEMYERRDLMVLGRTITAAELTANRLWFPFMVP